MLRRAPVSTRTYPLCPYTTLCRSSCRTTPLGASRRSCLELPQQSLDLGDVGIAERLAIGEVRDQRADAAAEQAIDEPLRFLADGIGALDRGAIEIAPTVGLGRHRAFLAQPREQRLHRRLRPTVDLADAPGQVGGGIGRATVR